MTMRMQSERNIRTMIAGLALGAMVLSSLGCSRNNIEAVNLANEGDKARASNVDEAISKYEQATQLDPQNHRILWKLANAYQKKQQWDKVALTCSKAEKLSPTHANYFFLHGYALAQQAVKGPTAWGDAKEPFETAIKLDPNYAEAHFELAQVLLQMDDEQGALKHYTEAVRKKPDELPFYGPLADLYIRLDYFDLADAVLKEALNYAKGDEGSFVIHSLAGQVKEVRGDYPGAIANYEAARKACGACNEKGQQIAFFNLGFAYSLASPPRSNEAIQQLETFQKMTCKGGASGRYADECAQAQERVAKLKGPVP